MPNQLRRSAGAIVVPYQSMVRNARKFKLFRIWPPRRLTMGHASGVTSYRDSIKAGSYPEII